MNEPKGIARTIHPRFSVWMSAVLCAGCSAIGGGRPNAVDGIYGPAQDPPPSFAAPSAEGQEGEEPAPSPAEGLNLDEGATTGDDEQALVSGFLSTRYRARWTGDAEDHDAYAILALDVGDAKRHPVTGYLMGRLWGDLGGSDPDDVFFGPDDTFSDSLSAILYQAYVDVHSFEALDKLRIGRQQDWNTPAFVVFDGVALERGDPKELSWGLYGGRRTQHYDTSTPDDVVAGAYGEGRLWKGSRVRLDAMYLEDEQRLGSNENELFGLRLWQTVSPRLTLEGATTVLEGDGRDVRLRSHYVQPEEGIALQATYYELLRTQREQALEVDPYFSALMEQRPYRQASVLASKGFGEDFVLNLGLDLRRLDEEGDESEFNHEFDRYFLSAAAANVLREGLELTLTGEVWNDDQQDIQTWGLDLRQQVDERLEAAVGSYYSLYKYDLFLNRERDDVRTYYVQARYVRSKTLTFDAELELEDDDFEDYRTFRIGARWLF